MKNKEAGMIRSFNNSKGLTLTEVLVAIVIVAMISVAVLAAITQSAVLTEHADDIYTASLLAQRRIDVLKKFPFSDLANIAAETDVAIDEDDDGKTDFVRSTTITENYGGFSDLLMIKVSVDRLVDGEAIGKPLVMEMVFADLTG